VAGVKLKSTLREVGTFKGIIRIVDSESVPPLFDVDKVGAACLARCAALLALYNMGLSSVCATSKSLCRVCCFVDVQLLTPSPLLVRVYCLNATGVQPLDDTTSGGYQAAATVTPQCLPMYGSTSERLWTSALPYRSVSQAEAGHPQDQRPGALCA